jgi:hypothetical protein
VVGVGHHLEAEAAVAAPAEGARERSALAATGT